MLHADRMLKPTRESLELKWIEYSFVSTVHPCNTKQKYRIKSQEIDFKSQIHERKL